VKRRWRQGGGSGSAPEAFLTAELRDLDPVEVSFGNWIQLAGVRLITEASGLTLGLRWRLLRKTHRPWRCFAHLLSEGKQIGSLDHELLESHPSPGGWEPGDEAYRRLRHWFAPPPDLWLRLGLYDPQVNVRCPVLASTLPIADQCTAVRVEPNQAARSGYAIQFEPLALTPCRVVFEQGVELAAYSVARQDPLVWLRLKWITREGPPRALRFFGHAIREPRPDAPSLAQLDQDVWIERRGPATAVEQNIVGPVDASAGCLRAGLADLPALRRLEIRSSTFPVEPAHQCLFVPLAPPLR